MIRASRSSLNLVTGSILAAAAVLVSVLASPQPAAALTAEESAVLGEISQRFGQVSSMNGEFVQFGPSGDRTQGKFFLEKPGKVRFQYDRPSKISVIADGSSVLVHDRGLQTYDIWPLGRTPLKFLLDDQLNLARSDKVDGVRIEPDLIQVFIAEASRFGGGRLTLFFDKTTFELRQWTVTDDQGFETSVAIYNVEIGNAMSSDLFKINYAAANAANKERRN